MVGDASEAVKGELLCMGSTGVWYSSPHCSLPHQSETGFPRSRVLTLAAASNTSCHLTSCLPLRTGPILLTSYVITQSVSSENWTIEVASIKSGSGHNMKTTFFLCFLPRLCLHLLCQCLPNFVHLQSTVSHHNFFHNLASLNKVLIKNAMPCYSATDGKTKSKSGGSAWLLSTWFNWKQNWGLCIFSYSHGKSVLMASNIQPIPITVYCCWALFLFLALLTYTRDKLFLR